MNPLKYLLPAVYAALTTPDKPEVEGVEVDVFQHLPNGYTGSLYVLIGQPTATPSGRAQACSLWSCTVLLDCVSLSEPGYVSSIPADELADQLTTRLFDVVLSLGGGWQASRAQVEQITGLQDAFDGEQTDTHRYVRMRFDVYFNL